MLFVITPQQFLPAPNPEEGHPSRAGPILPGCCWCSPGSQEMARGHQQLGPDPALGCGSLILQPGQDETPDAEDKKAREHWAAAVPLFEQSQGRHACMSHTHILQKPVVFL